MSIFEIIKEARGQAGLSHSMSQRGAINRLGERWQSRHPDEDPPVATAGYIGRVDDCISASTDRKLGWNTPNGFLDD